MAGTTQAEISDIQCELDMIESSFATISSIMESFNQPADVTSAVNRDEEEKADCPKPITARLVFGGAVVQPEANIMVGYRSFEVSLDGLFGSFVFLSLRRRQRMTLQAVKR